MTEKIIRRADLHAWCEKRGICSPYAPVPMDKDPRLWEWSRSMAGTLWLRANADHGVDLNGPQIAAVLYEAVVDAKKRTR